MKENLQGADPITNGEGNTAGLHQHEVSDDPAQSKTPRTSRNIMHENRETWSASAAQSGGRPVGEGESRTAHMHADQGSDSGVVPLKGSNKEGQPTAESLEGRPGTKENVRQPHTQPTQGGERVTQGLEGVRQAAKERRQEKFTALLHHLTIDLLRESFQALKRSAAAGVDGMTWKEYEQGREDRLRDLHDRVHRGTYRAQPSRRVYIRKEDGRQRPLGVAALEDKIVQQAVTRILNQIYEEDFLGFSYGFRPERSQHQALDALTVGIERKKVNWILDLDIRGFFDNLNHEQLVQYVEERIADPRILRLIRKWLKAGVCEEGQWKETEVGTPQGSGISPLLANVYLHYALDLWVEAWRKGARGDVIIVRYADDAVLGFENRGGVRKPGRSGRLAQGTARATAEGRLRTTPGEDPTDGVRAVRREQSQAERRGKTRDVQFSGLHPHLWADPDDEALSGPTGDDRQADAREAAGNPAAAAAADARSGSGDGEVAAVGRSGLLQLSRGSRKRETAIGFPGCCDSVLAADVEPSEPTPQHHVGADGPVGKPVDSQCPHYASLSERAL